MVAMAAAILTLSSPTPTSTLLPLTNSPFKGNTASLKLRQNPSPFPSLSAPKSCLVVAAAAAAGVALTSTPTVPAARFRLDNLGPQPGSKKKGKRKGRGIAAGQGNSCGFGMRGQKSRSGPRVRTGFAGGQMPLYRRLPKLRGIAGGMHAGLPKFVPVNLKGIVAAGFQEGDEISLESLKEKG